MKAKLHPTIEEYRGVLGDLVFREVNGNTIVARRGTINVEPTAKQTAVRVKFKSAAGYGKEVLANDGLRALYEETAKERKISPYALALADYMKAPTIDNVDLSAYTGHVGSHITIQASDDFSLASVHVSLVNSGGMPLENGEAVETGEGSHMWVYTAKFNVPADTLVTVRVVATDLPGGTAVQEDTKQL